MWSLARIALRNVLRNRRRSLLTGLAVILGIGAVVFVRGVLNGFEEVVVRDLVEGRTGALSVHNPAYLRSEDPSALTLDIPGDAAFLHRLEELPGVRAVAPRIAFVASASVGDASGYALVQAVDPAREATTLPRAREAVVAGRPIARRGEALVGAELARGLGAHVGDMLTLLAQDRDGVLNAMEARIVGLLAYKQPGDKRVAQVALADADALLRMKGRVTGIAIAIDGFPTEEWFAQVRDRLNAALGLAGRAVTWRELATWISDLLLFQRILFGVLAVTILVVAVTGITNSMLLSVLERVREIGTLMALGVRRRRILALFLLESGFLGLLGGIAGAALGALLVAALRRTGIDLRTPGVEIPQLVRPFVGPAEAAAAVAVACAGSILSALYPALKASRLRPVEALSHA